MFTARTFAHRGRWGLAASLSMAALVGASQIALVPEGAAQGAEGPPPPAVIVEAVRSVDFKSSMSFSGRVEAIDKIEVKTRVAGLITKRAFKEGQEVDKGQLLFEIDRRPYEIALAQAQANLASSKAAMEAAADSYNRTQELVTRQVSSGATLTSAKSQLAQAQAKVTYDEAQVEQAKLNLEFTQIRAEIDGRVGRASHTVGDYVNEGSSPLVTLVSNDIVYVSFAVPRPVLRGLKRSSDGAYESEIEIRHGGGEVYKTNGKISFVDIEANSSTNTVMVRAAVVNDDGDLLPQELIDATIVDKDASETLVVSQSALMLDQNGAYVLALDADDKVEIRRFEPGVYRGAVVTVKSGLSEGDRVIVSGHLKAQPGMVVKPEFAPIEISKNTENPTP